MNRRSRARNEIARKVEKLFFIATEGQETEPRYFEAFRPLQKDSNVKTFDIKVFPSKTDSSPDKVLKRVKSKLQEYQLRKGDEVWIVIDFDSWEGLLSEVQKECVKLGFNLAVSKPCFEIWLVLHSEKRKTPDTAARCEELLGSMMDKQYNKSKYDTQYFVNRVNNAIKHAREIRGADLSPWPNTPNSYVFLLMEHLLNS